MKFTCLQENLSPKLAVVNRAVAPRGSLSILSNILITAEKNSVKLSATNLQLSLSTWVGASVEETGSITVPGPILTNFIATVPPQKLHFESKKTILRIETEAGWAQINGAGSEEFPKIDDSLGEQVLELPSAELKKAISEVVFSAATDEGRPILTGILFSADATSDSLALVGVDGFRLSESLIKLSSPVSLALRWIIPARALGELPRLLDEVGKVELGLKDKENELRFRVGETLLSSRLLEGDFPDYKQIVPKGFKVEAKILLEDLRKAVQSAAIFTSASSNVVRLKLSPAESLVTISANTQEVGDTVTRVPGEVTGEEEEIAFNTRYLTDVLNHLSCEQLILAVQDSLSPGMIKRVGDDNFLHIIMPVRLQGS